MRDRLLVRLILSRGADIATTGRHGQTPLHLAARNSHVEVARVLIEGGADVHAVDDHGRTPFWCARGKSRAEVITLLEQHGATSEPIPDVVVRDRFSAQTLVPPLSPPLPARFASHLESNASKLSSDLPEKHMYALALHTYASWHAPLDTTNDMVIAMMVRLEDCQEGKLCVVQHGDDVLVVKPGHPV